MEKFYFRCKSNPTAPLLVLESAWEAKEMRTNLEYDRVDESGLPVFEAETEDASGLPFRATGNK